MYYWKDWKNWKGVASTRGFPFVDPKICSHLFSLRASLRWRRFLVWRMVPWWLAQEIGRLSEWARQVPLSPYAKGDISGHFCILAPPLDYNWIPSGCA